MERQYIGARYVPKFWDNGSGSTEWTPNIPYESLVVVTYLGNSYTSKVPVPATQVTPNLDTEHWALTGNFNGQLYNLSGRVDELNEKTGHLQEEIDNIGFLPYTMNNAKIRLFGDSWTKTNDAPEVRMVWSDFLPELLPTSATVINQAISGSRITGSNATAINQVIASTQDDSETTHIVLFGGLNDWGSGVDIDTFTNTLETIANNLDTKFPNATVIAVGVFDQKWYNSAANQLRPVLLYNVAYEKVASKYNWVWLSPYACPGWSGTRNSRYAYDGNPYHPTSEYAKIICDWIYTSMLTNRGFSNPNISVKVDLLKAFNQEVNTIYKDVDFADANISTFNVTYNSNGTANLHIEMRPAVNNKRYEILKRTLAFRPTNDLITSTSPYIPTSGPETEPKVATALVGLSMSVFTNNVSDVVVSFDSTYDIRYFVNSAYQQD